MVIDGLIEDLIEDSLSVGLGGCFEGWTGESNAAVGSVSIMSTSIDEIDILCVGAMTMSGVCGSPLFGGGFVSMSSRLGACSSPGLVVGDAGSGTGVWEDATSLDEAGDDCASCCSDSGRVVLLFVF